MMHSIIENNKDRLIELCQKYDVESMYVFGSAASGNFNDSSDIDILISFKNELSIENYTDNYFNLYNQLKALFNRKVDLVTERSLSNPYFIKGIDETKKLLYAA